MPSHRGRAQHRCRRCRRLPGACFNGAWCAGVPAWTTAPSSSSQRSATGAGSTVHIRSSSNPAHLGGTPGSNCSTPAPATSSSTSNSSTACSKPRRLSKTGASTTAPRRPHSSLGRLTPTDYAKPGPTTTNNSHNQRTTKRGQACTGRSRSGSDRYRISQRLIARFGEERERVLTLKCALSGRIRLALAVAMCPLCPLCPLCPVPLEAANDRF